MRSRTNRRWAGAFTAAVMGGACVSGGPPEPPRMCLEIEASSRLNFFAEQPHILVVHLYSLSNATTFETLSSRELLISEKISGMTEPDRRTLEVEPGQRIELEDPLPRDTVKIGVVADFYGAPAKVVVDAECGLFGGERVVLSSNDLQVSR